jgi:hypothetical protein
MALVGSPGVVASTVAWAARPLAATNALAARKEPPRGP